MRISRRVLIEIALALMVGIAAYWFMPEPLPELTRAEFLEEVHAGHVSKIEIEDQELILSESTSRGPFRTGFDRARDQALPDQMRALGVEVWYSKSPPGI